MGEQEKRLNISPYTHNTGAEANMELYYEVVIKVVKRELVMLPLRWVTICPSCQLGAITQRCKCWLIIISAVHCCSMA